MGLRRAIAKGANWLFNTPAGNLTFGMIYGASLVYLWCKDQNERETLGLTAFGDGVEYGLKMAEKAENGEKSPILVLKSGKITRVIRVKRDENEPKDYGAKIGGSCTMIENPGIMNDLWCKGENFMVQDDSAQNTPPKVDGESSIQ
jgi:hypothetical protein